MKLITSQLNLPAHQACGLAGCLVMLLLAAGCSSPGLGRLPANAGVPYNVGIIQPSDVLQITFPGAPAESTQLIVPVEGTIKLAFAGEFQAAGRTARELEENILEVYGPQLQVREVTVSVINPAAAVYVTGAVLAPRKVPMLRPLTLLDAIMECGGLQPERARASKTRLIRDENGMQRIYQINLKKILEEDTRPVYLRPGDVIYVPLKVFNL